MTAPTQTAQTAQAAQTAQTAQAAQAAQTQTAAGKAPPAATTTHHGIGIQHDARHQQEGFLVGAANNYHSADQHEWSSRPHQASPIVKGAACITSEQETCTWEAGQRFWHRTPVPSEPALAAAELESLKFLVVDGHGGPLLDTVSFLKGAGVPKENIFDVCADKPGYCRKEYHPEWKWLWELTTEFFNEGFSIALFRNASYVKRVRAEVAKQVAVNGQVDVMICLYPGFQCLLLWPLSKTIIIKFHHRFQHFVWQNDQQRYGLALTKAAQCGNFVMAAASAYDHMHQLTLLGVDSMPWPSLGLHKQERTGRANKLFYRKPWPYFKHPVFEDMVHAATQNESLVNIAAGRPGGLDAPDAQIFVPYSAHAAAFVEDYFSGTPLMVPSHRLTTQWHNELGLVWHRLWGFKHNREGYVWPRDLFPESLSTPCCHANVANAEDAHYWMEMLDTSQWPNVTYFDNEADLLVKLKRLQDDNEFREAILNDMREFRLGLQKRSFAIFRTTLKRLMDSTLPENKDSYCTDLEIPEWNV